MLQAWVAWLIHSQPMDYLWFSENMGALLIYSLHYLMSCIFAFVMLSRWIIGFKNVWFQRMCYKNFLVNFYLTCHLVKFKITCYPLFFKYENSKFFFIFSWQSETWWWSCLKFYLICFCSIASKFWKSDDNKQFCAFYSSTKPLWYTAGLFILGRDWEYFVRVAFINLSFLFLNYSMLFETDGRFMMRLKLPNGVTTSEQTRYLASVIDGYGKEGCADVTTRQNWQIRGVELPDVPEIIDGLMRVGLTSLQSGMDNVRNPVGNPLAGIDPHEIVDTRPYTNLLSAFITANSCGNAAISNLWVLPYTHLVLSYNLQAKFLFHSFYFKSNVWYLMNSSPCMTIY